jgi:aminopeptidase N
VDGIVIGSPPVSRPRPGYGDPSEPEVGAGEGNVKALSRRSSSRIAAVTAGVALLVGALGASPAEASLPGPARWARRASATPTSRAYGNGGYDVRHYDLDVSYEPATDRLEGQASITARATQDLCSLDLDLVGLEVRDVEVGHRQATWARSGHELTVTPRRPIRAGQRFEGVDLLFDNAIYVRGAMALQALRQEVGDEPFWRIIRGWASTKSGGNATTEEFIAFAEQVSGQQLDELFTTWLFTPGKPSLAGSADSAAALSTQAGTSAGDWWQRAQAQHERGRY